MRQDSQASPLPRYSVAIFSTLLALLLRWLLLPVLGNSSPFILFYLAIAVSGWYGGLGPGLAATVLSGVFVTLFLFESPTSRNTTNLPFLVIFMIIGAVLSTLNESLHRARRRIAQDTRQLAQTNERFYLLVASVQDYGIFMLDPEGHIISWNEGAQRIKGYTADEIIGRHFSCFYPQEEIAGGKPEQELRVAAEVGRVEEEGWRLRKDGSRFWANVVIAAIRDETGELRGFSKVTRDMTDRKEAEQRARLLVQEQAARAEAEAANRTKDEFLCVLSHELRTPLTAIMGWSNLLLGGRLDPASATHALEAIERNCKAQTRLVEDLLDVSQIITGRMSLNLRPFKLTPAVAAGVDVVRPIAETKGVKLLVQLEDGVGFISGDPVRLQQVVWNLLSNAVKFTPSGGQVELRLRKAGAQAQMIVSDTGAGIEREFLPLVFDRFRQGDSSSTREHGGLGLGLAIVRHVIQAQGGTVEAESAGPGQGATFTVRLPLLAMPPALSERDVPPALPERDVPPLALPAQPTEGGHPFHLDRQPLRG